MIGSTDDSAVASGDDAEGFSEHSIEALVRAWEPAQLGHETRGAGETDGSADWERSLWSDWDIVRSGSIQTRPSSRPACGGSWPPSTEP
jgi:hypothetical protein